MQKIIFNQITIEGFGSYIAKTTIDLDKKGLNLIKGKNGAGKTTQFSALAWVLYGNTLKNINKKDIPTWKELRPTNWSGTIVNVYFSIGSDIYNIVRTLDGVYDGKKQSSIFIYKNDTLITDALYKSDQQSYINNLLQMDFNVFCNTVLFGQRMKRFLQSSNEDKRNVLETAFQLEWLSQLKDICVKHITELNNEVYSNTKSRDKLLNEQKLVQNDITRLQTYLIDFSSLRDKSEIDFLKSKSDLETLEQKHSKLVVLMNDAELALTTHQTNNPSTDLTKEFQDKANQLQTTDNQLNKVQADLEAKYRSNETEIAKINANINKLVVNSCPECNSLLNVESVNNLKAKYEKELSDLTLLKETIIVEGTKNRALIAENTTLIAEQNLLISNETEKVKARIKDLEVYGNNVTNTKKDVINVLTEIENVNTVMIKCLNVLNEFTAKTETINTEIATLVDKDFILTNQIDAYNHVINDFEKELENYEWWNKKGFSNGGLKTWVFTKYLEILNLKVAKYANYIGLDTYICIDFEKTSKPFETVIYQNGVELNYDSLSGGEKQKIDICFAFGLHDVNGEHTCNLLILDEVFEAIDDYGGIDQIFDLIKFKLGNENTIFIITHNKDMDCQNANEIIFEKNELGSYVC